VKRLKRKQMKVRFNELRDYYGTFLLDNNIKQIEINLLQGRIPVKIFVRHYWSPKLSELRDRTLKAISLLEQTL
jgi:intergrase/recombinase